MKTLRILSLCSLFFSFAFFANAQSSKTETIAVSGNCGMCKSSIEKAARSAGATKANWNKDSKMLTVSYKTSGSSSAKIQQAIAAVGYDTKDVKATDEAYDNLHACCKYDRVKTDEVNANAATHVKADCCDQAGNCTSCANCVNCTKADCCSKDGKKGADCCGKDCKHAGAKDASCCSETK